MYFRIPSALCWAVLIVGLASAAQSSQKGNSDQTFDLDADGEGSADGEVTRDLEASGSGDGPSDDEDNDGPFNRNNHPPPNPKEPIEGEIIPKKTDLDLVVPPNPTEDSSVVVMNPKSEDRPASFFAQPGILAAVIGGAVVGLLCAILVVMFIVYRMRKKDEGSYALGEPKQSPNSNSYSRGSNSKEFFA